eukprot:scaffold24_cov341-Pavlova_lutheri.AAC.54
MKICISRQHFELLLGQTAPHPARCWVLEFVHTWWGPGFKLRLFLLQSFVPVLVFAPTFGEGRAPLETVLQLSNAAGRHHKGSRTSHRLFHCVIGGVPASV